MKKLFASKRATEATEDSRRTSIQSPDNQASIKAAAQPQKRSGSKETGPESLPHHEDAMEFAMKDTLSAPQKRGFCGLTVCLLALVNDGSPELQWSKTYLQVVVEGFLGLPPAQVAAFLPMLTARHDALVDMAVSPRSAQDRKLPPPLMEKLDPAPFLALIVPVAEKESFSWSSLIGKKPKDNNEKEGKSGKGVTSPTLVRADKEAVAAFQLKIVKNLLWFTVKTIGYDARARTFLRILADSVGVSWKKVNEEEFLIGRTLFAEATAMPMEKSAAKLSVWDWKRNATIGAAAVTGGALLALTGGLAAPAIAASISALGGAGVAIGTVLGSAAGVTATTILFGTAGAGVVGMKTDTRTRGVQEFSFDLVSAGDGMNVYICVSGWLDEDDPNSQSFRRSWGDSREYLRAFYRKANDKKVEQVDQVLGRYKGREDEFFAILRKTYRIQEGKAERDPLGLKAASDKAYTTEEETPTTAEMMRAWRWKDRFAQGDQYCLEWEEKLLRKFGKSMRSFAKEQAFTYANNEIVKFTAFAALFAAVAIPRTLLSAANMIDNVWVLMMNNSDESGKILAEALRRREQGLRPVTLVGYGMGARLLFSCLKELTKYEDCFGIVENVVLLGTPVPVVADEWKRIRRMISGRLINGYSEHDWMLAVMYRYQGWALNSAGIGPIEIPGVENVNLSSIIKGHMEYKNKIGAVLDLLKLEG
ncbi:hypothetical protein Poli38472_005222 [Pythium oligandrum]|uniref:Transmembrane and coiled-coil domain-containing protein 4 n=1 Tax=Pythium oligandrum TaxID=41045 RepID=A0A8K1CFM9_PYTOL|nr:hypothetical protein Poli38472_005222 [Pythium oligandrum]|eukprot:TMW62604.1 hypothetical protein Poli38472_005222 [Pythium oligandrum]